MALFLLIPLIIFLFFVIKTSNEEEIEELNVHE
jgi:thioredoxin-related protein